MVAQSKSVLDQPESLQVLLAASAVDPYLIPRTPAGNRRRACFATISRLLTCLVNEQLVDAYYVEHHNSSSSTVSTGASTGSHIFVVPHDSEPTNWSYCSIVSQMRHRPVLSKAPAGQFANIHRVLFLDPEDIGASQWIQHGNFAESMPVTEPRHIMVQVGKWNSSDESMVEAICSELASSVENQAHAYDSPRPKPDILKSTSIEWEQSIVEGHATHPMHRARYAVPPLEPIAPDADLFHLYMAFVAVPRSELRIEGEFEALLAPLYSSADADDGKNQYILDFVDRSSEVVMPVHPLHLPAVLRMFKFARRLPFSAPADAQASLRTVCPKSFSPLGYDIKLPLGIKVSSALRTISPWSTYVGPRITRVIPEILRGSPVQDALLIAGEPASAVSTNEDFDIAKYLSCVIRDDPEYICRPRGERVILAAALTNYNDDGTSMAVNQWKLDSVEKRTQFLRNYVGKLFDAFLPPIVNHCFAFESHPQNTLLRISAETGEIKGFIVRDFGGVKVHRETFKQSTGVDIDMLPDSFTDAQSTHEVYDLAYHTLIQCQVHRLVRALGLHYHGDGWAVVREEFEQRVPKSHPLHSAWHQECFDLKCFVIMKLGGLYRDYIYRKVPNVLFYKNEEEGIVFPPTS